MKTITLITCNNSADAHIIKAQLDAESIESFLTNENFSNLMSINSAMPGFGIQVVVKESDLIKARDIIKDKLETNNEIHKCPYCGSSDISLRIENKFGKRIATILLFLSALVPFGNKKTKYYCNNCKKEILI